MKIVLTGAPGSGKTTIGALLAASRPGLVHITEAATRVYGNRGLRWDRIDLETKREVQRAIYHHQCEQEAAIPAGASALLDRGTVDGAAYWPEGPAAYWDDLGTTHAAELARYDAVILLESAAAVGFYDGNASNAVRFEDADAALANAKILADLWRPHPHRIEISATANFDEKIKAVGATLDNLLEAEG